MNPITESIVGAAWEAGNCCKIGHAASSKAVLINTPMVIGYTLPIIPGGLFLPPAANANRPQARPVA